MPKITKITVARLYNLGNYEHVRYELTAEVGDGECAASAFTGIENILTVLDPQIPHGILDTRGLLSARERIEQIRAQAPDDSTYHRYLNEGASDQRYETREECLVRLECEYSKIRNRSVEFFARRKKAQELLDDLGGAANWVDAKKNWEDDDCEF